MKNLYFGNNFVSRQMLISAKSPTVFFHLKVVFHSKELFFSNFLLLQVMVIFKHADPNDAQKLY